MSGSLPTNTAKAMGVGGSLLINTVPAQWRKIAGVLRLSLSAVSCIGGEALAPLYDAFHLGRACVRMLHAGSSRCQILC